MLIRSLVTLWLIAAVQSTARPSAASSLLVSGASSLTEVLPELVQTFHKTHAGVHVRMNFGSSGSLQRQIEQGAPVDVFLSASKTQMDALQKNGLIQSKTRVSFASNEIVLVARKDHKTAKTWADLKRANVSHIAISDPQSVPSGQYARQTLEKLGLWKAVERKLVLGENVRQTLAYVEQGGVDAGVVFATDLRIAPDLRLLARAPRNSHTDVVYTAAAVKSSREPADAATFARFLNSRAAQAVLKRFGFTAAPDR